MVNQYVSFPPSHSSSFFIFCFCPVEACTALGPVQALPRSSVRGWFRRVVLSLVKKFYFVYKINDMEKDVLSSLAAVFDACKDVDANNCDHEHAGFVRLLKKVSTCYRET